MAKTKCIRSRDKKKRNKNGIRRKEMEEEEYNEGENRWWKRK